MGDLARPSRHGDEPPVTPVQAHRVSPDARVIEALERIAAGADRSQAPPPPPPASPTVIYIQTGAAPAASAAAPSPPPPAPSPATEVHYHTTNVYHKGGRGSRRKSVSALGVVSVMLGMAGCVLYWVKAYQAGAIPIGVIGLSFGVLGFVLSVLVRHTRAGTPLAGIVVCLVAVAQPLYWTGWLESQAKEHAPEISDYLRPELTEGLVNPAPVAAPAGEGHRGEVAPPASPAAPRTPAPVPAEKGGMARPAEAASPVSAVEAARRRLAKAEQDAEAALERNVQYRDAKADVADAEARVKALRQTASGGSLELTAASQQWMEAQNRLQKLRATLLAQDPQVQATRRALAEAEAREHATEAHADEAP